MNPLPNPETDLPHTMLAMICPELSEKAQLELREVDQPEPGPGEALIRVEAATLNFPDVLMMAGRYQVRPEAPFIPGAEGAGIIVGGPAATGALAPGARVAMMPGTGAFGQYVVARAADCTVLSPSMDFTEGAAFYLRYGTAYLALKLRGHIVPGAKLLVMGASSGVGLAAVDLGVAMGAIVTAAGSSAERLAPAKAAGAGKLVVSPRSFADKAAKKQFTNDLKALEPDGFDLILDPVGGDYAEPAFRAIAPQGRYLVVGFAASPQIPAIPLNLVLLKSADLVGAHWSGSKIRNPEWKQEAEAALGQLYEAGKIAPRRLQVMPISKVNEAIAMMRNRQVSGTGIAFEMDWRD